MEITNTTRTIISMGMEKKGFSKSDLAEALGIGNSWVTKLFDGTLKRLNSDVIGKLEDALDIQFVVVVESGIQPMAKEISKEMERNPQLGKVVEELLKLSRDNEN